MTQELGASSLLLNEKLSLPIQREKVNFCPDIASVWQNARHLSTEVSILKGQGHFSEVSSTIDMPRETSDEKFRLLKYENLSVFPKVSLAQERIEGEVESSQNLNKGEVKGQNILEVNEMT